MRRALLASLVLLDGVDGMTQACDAVSCVQNALLDPGVTVITLADGTYTAVGTNLPLMESTCMAMEPNSWHCLPAEDSH